VGLLPLIPFQVFFSFALDHFGKMSHLNNYQLKEFEIYRPEKHSDRLELFNENGEIIPKEDVWKPSISYKVKLSEVKSQFTPAEYFKYRLQTSGKYIRMIQRLEARWKRNYTVWNNAALRIQAAYKRMKSRFYFQTIKDGLFKHLKHRRLLEAARAAFFTEKNYEKTIELSLTTEYESEELLTLSMKSHYRLSHYSECISIANSLLSENNQNEEAAYFKACCLTAGKQYDDALSTLKDVMSVRGYTADHLFALCGCLCFEVFPPLYDNAIDCFSELVHRNPRDFDSVSEVYCFLLYLLLLFFLLFPSI
jgi:tetratricopeptide (TPR) repeat protein